MDPATIIALAQAAKSGYDMYKGNKAEKEQQHIAKFRERRAAQTAKKGTREVQRQLKKDILPSSLSDIQKRMERAGEGANRFYEPVVQRAVNTFNQQTVPQLITQMGGSGFKTSSPMRQALSQAGLDLSENIAATLAGAKERYASNLYDTMSRAKMFNAQNRGNMAQFSLSDPSAYIPQTNQGEQSLTNFGQAWSNLGKTQIGEKFPGWFGQNGQTPPIAPTTTNIGGQ